MSSRPHVIVATAFALAAVASGCGSERPNRPNPPADFAPADAAAREAATVYLRASANGGSREEVLVDVVARGLDRTVHGTAFRLHWEPERLVFVAASTSNVWSRDAIALAKEGVPGELVVTWSEKGASGGVSLAGKETVLGTLRFAPKEASGAALDFRTERSTLRDGSGTPLAVEWRGGRFEPHR